MPIECTFLCLPISKAANLETLLVINKRTEKELQHLTDTYIAKIQQESFTQFLLNFLGTKNWDQLTVVSTMKLRCGSDNFNSS